MSRLAASVCTWAMTAAMAMALQQTMPSAIPAEFSVVMSGAASLRAWLVAQDGAAPSVLAQRTVKDVEADALRVYVQHYVLDEAQGALRAVGPATQETQALCACISSKGKVFRALATSEQKAKGEDERVLLEVQGQHGAVSRIDASEAHGKVLGDAWLGGCSWSGDERFVAYAALARKPKGTSFFDTQKGKAGDEPRRSRFAWAEDWGERFTGVSEVVLCVLDTHTGMVSVVDSSPDLTPGEPIFTPSGDGLLYTAWSSKPSKLGLLHCFNRRSSLYHVDISALRRSAEGAADAEERPLVHTLLTPGMAIARSPRFSPNGTNIVFLASTEGFDTHSGCLELFVAPWGIECPLSVSAHVCVPLVPTPSPGAFPGLFLASLPQRCFVDEHVLVCSTAWGCRLTAVAIDTILGQVTKLALAGKLLHSPDAGDTAPAEGMDAHEAELHWNAAEDGSVTVHDVLDGYVMLSGSTPTIAPRIAVLRAKAGHPLTEATILRAGPSASIAVSTTTISAQLRQLVAQRVSEVRWTVLRAPCGEVDGFGAPVDHNDLRSDASVECVLILPPRRDDGQLPPLVVVPHGGPHTTSLTTFTGTSLYLCVSARVAVLFVNYRGTPGYGKAFLASLPGKIGTRDVADVFSATKYVYSMNPPIVDATRVGIAGGSHGGFLAAHMISQFPETYKACVMRNPVAHIPSMACVTDIPDWCYTESLGEGQYDWGRCGYPELSQLQSMHQSSPAVYIHRAKAPTLLSLGAKDSSNGVETELLMYPEDDHALDRPATEADQFINMKLWFDTHL